MLDDINFAINQGEITTIIGPNGAGKTTLIKMIIGLMKQTSGMVYKNDNLSIGYVPQKIDVSRFMPMTVARFMAISSKNSEEEISDALNYMQVEYLYNKQINSLSGGELQRIFLARAISRKPQLLVLDEPAQGMDINAQALLYQHIQNLRDEIGCAVIIVSHDLNVVMSGTDKVICLNKHICCSGTAEKVTEHPEFYRLFGENYAKSMALYKHHHNHEH